MLCHQPEQARRHIVLKNQMCDSPAPFCVIDEPRPYSNCCQNGEARRGSKGLLYQQTSFDRPFRRRGNVLSIHQHIHVMRSPQLLLLTTSLLVNLVGAFISPTVGWLGSSSRRASRRWFRHSPPQPERVGGCDKEARRQRLAVLLRVAATTAIVPPEAATWTADDDNNNNDPRVGVLLLNLGGPETGDDVEGKSGSGSAIY
jgi:hypothetical protein